MSDIFTPVIQKLWDIGAIQFLFPYILTSAIFYGLLRKSQVFGEPEKNVAVNAVVALVASFMVWASPAILGIDVGTHLIAFFTQGLVVTLVFMIALLVAGMFLPPDLPKHLAEGLFAGSKAAGILVVGVVMGLVIFATSGLWTVILGPELVEKAWDVVVGIIVILLLAVPIIFITYEKAPPKVEEKPEEKGG